MASRRPRSAGFLQLVALLLGCVLALAQAFLTPPTPLQQQKRPLAPITVLRSASLPNPFGGKGKAASSAAASSTVPGIAIQEVSVNELRLAARVCIYAFFDSEPGKLGANPIKSMQLASLEDEQLRDLRSRFGGRRLGRGVMLKAVVEATGAMVGFVELRVRTDLKYGMGPGVEPRDERPYLANLAVLPSARRKGIAKALVRAGEALVQSWGYDELILQVEDTNAGARKLYRQLGYTDVYADPAGRKYVLEGMGIKTARIKKIGMRKALGRGGGSPLSGLFGGFWK